MAKEMFKPDAVLDGQEFSALTRLVEALHNRKSAGVDKAGLDSARTAQRALELNESVGTADLKSLLEAAKAYKKACEDDKLEPIPNVKGLELDRVIKKLEGMVEQGETTDDQGNKVHPASLPPGEEPAKTKPEDIAQNVRIIETPDMIEKKQEESMKASRAQKKGKTE